MPGDYYEVAFVQHMKNEIEHDRQSRKTSKQRKMPRVSSKFGSSRSGSCLLALQTSTNGVRMLAWNSNTFANTELTMPLHSGFEQSDFELKGSRM
jgi:hypothetical protein